MDQISPQGFKGDFRSPVQLFHHMFSGLFRIDILNANKYKAHFEAIYCVKAAAH